MKRFWKTCSLSLLAVSFMYAQRGPFRPTDLREWHEVTEVRISPDGKAAVYAERHNDPATGKSSSNLWLIPADGGNRQPLTQGIWRDWSPQWASDPPPGGGGLAYLTNREGRAQIRISRGAGAEDAVVTGIEQAPLAFALSPRGDAIAFTAFPAGQDARQSAAWAPPAILPFLRPAFEPRAQLFVTPVSGGAARQLTTGDLNWTGEPAWMPDGQSVLCAASAGTDPQHPLRGAAIFRVRIADGAMKQLTQTGGDDEQPTPSPDGSRIAWLSTAARAQSYNLRGLFVMHPDGSRAKQLGGAFERDVSRPQWSSDSRTVYFLAEDAGAENVYAARADGSVHPVTEGAARLRDFSLAGNGRAAAIRSSAREAGDVIVFDADLRGPATALYAPDAQLLAGREVGAVEELHYNSAGHAIQAWLVKPPGFDAGKKYPLLVDVRDSPRAMYGYEFHLRAQILAAAGFVVLLANPRGSPGYGEQFGALPFTRNPGDDADDLLRGVDAAIAKGYIDSKRVMISGGLTAAWMLAHSDRFAAAVLRDPIADRTVEIALAPDGLRRAASQMGALPWEDPAQYWQHSPIYFAGAFRTPTLLVSRPGDPQAREIYFALEARRIDCALAEIPQDGAAAQVNELEAEIAWLKR